MLTKREGEQMAEIERLTAENKQQALRIDELEGDLEVMRLQRDATQASRCPNCERLRAALDEIADRFWESEGDN